MAVTEAGAVLTEAHRTAQLGILESLLRSFEKEWTDEVAFDPAAFASWVAEQAPEVASAYRLSAETAQRYYERFREAEGVQEPFTSVILDPLDPWAWSESVARWGPAYVTALVEDGLAEEAAARRSLVALSLDATRTFMAGGRTALAALMQAEPRRVRWARIARARCCAFCAMLASRGPVYSSAWAAGAGRHWHRGCKCTVEPYFGRGRYRLHPTSQQYATMWDNLEYANLNAFRRELEQQRRKEDEAGEGDE